jgi:ribonuclease III
MKKRNEALNNLETNLNLIFKDKSLLEMALTHSSYANQKKDIKYNERLEFLGDSVLQVCITEYLFINYKEKSEGELTKIRSLIVCENSLYEVANKWGIGKYIQMSKGEELTGGRERVSIQADCVEAIIAAIYLDQGFEKVRAFIIENFEDTIKRAVHNEIILDYKTKLQEILQKKGDLKIEYKLDKYEGPPHRRKFFTSVFINNQLYGEGEGFSKKEAEQFAAKVAITRMEDVLE